MGGVDTRDRYHVHWGSAEQYAERREESALRRSGRAVPDRAFEPFERIDLAPLDAILAAESATGPASALSDHGADAGGLRPPARRGAPAHRPPDRRLVQRALRHRDLVPAPALRAAERPTSCASAAARSARCSGVAASSQRSASISAPTSAASAPTAPCASRRPTAAASPRGSPRVEVDGQVLPRSSEPRMPSAIAAALRADVAQGRPA